MLNIFWRNSEYRQFVPYAKLSLLDMYDDDGVRSNIAIEDDAI